MLQVKLPAEIQEYKSKLIWGLSVRQIISIGVALLVCVPVGVLGYGHISSDILPWIIMLLAAPCIAWGFFTIQGMKFEDYAKCFLEYTFLPQERVFEDTETNIFLTIHSELVEEEIVKQRIASGEYESEQFYMEGE